MKSSTLACSITLGLGVVAGCGPTINEEHCLFRGGDASCDADQACVIVVGGGVVPDAVNGCVEAGSDPAQLDEQPQLHLRYGLPRGATTEDGTPERDTVYATLERRIASEGLDEGCLPDATLPLELDDPSTLDVVFGARARLEGLRAKRKIRDEQAFVVQDEAEAVRQLYAAIDAWELACAPMIEETSGDTTGTGTGTSDSTDTSSTGVECESNDDCPDPTASFCDPMGACVSCDALEDPNGACASDDPSRPVCEGTTCVPCTTVNDQLCAQDGLVCEPETNSCVVCSDHDQCGAAACNFFSGRCFPADAVAHVGPGQEYATISTAMEWLGTEGTIVIYDSAYNESITVDIGTSFAFLAADGEMPEWNSTAGPQLRVLGEAIVDRLRIANNFSAAGVEVDGGSAWLDRTWIIETSEVTSAVNGAELVLRSSVLGSSGFAIRALHIESATATIEHSTLIGGALGPSLVCNESSSVTARNSIIVTDEGSAIFCPGAGLSHCATTEVWDGNADGNTNVGVVQGAWFVDEPADDYHLSVTGAAIFEGVALWRDGDPTTDIDGDPRPTIDGTPDYAGADIP